VAFACCNLHVKEAKIIPNTCSIFALADQKKQHNEKYLDSQAWA